MTHFPHCSSTKVTRPETLGLVLTTWSNRGRIKSTSTGPQAPEHGYPLPADPPNTPTRPLTSIISINIVAVPRESRSIFNGPDIRLSEKLCLISMLKLLPEQSAPQSDPSVGPLSSALPALRVSLLRFLCLLEEANNIP